jgi:hypothetical protein
VPREKGNAVPVIASTASMGSHVSCAAFWSTTSGEARGIVAADGQEEKAQIRAKAFDEHILADIIGGVLYIITLICVGLLYSMVNIARNNNFQVTQRMGICGLPLEKIPLNIKRTSKEIG